MEAAKIRSPLAGNWKEDKIRCRLPTMLSMVADAKSAPAAALSTNAKL
jgi:hypothetical protein